MRIGEILNGVYDKSVGWRPASGSIKPVHIANGVFRDLAGETYDVKRAVAFLIPWKKKNEGEAIQIPNELMNISLLKQGMPDIRRFLMDTTKSGLKSYANLFEVCWQLTVPFSHKRIFLALPLRVSK